MAWTVPMTAVANTVFTAAQFNASVRDNLNETAPAKATAMGRVFAATGANQIAERFPYRAFTSGGGQGTSSTSFTDLTTPGPTTPALTTGQSVIWTVSAFVQNTSATQGGLMSLQVSGASSIAAGQPGQTLRVISAGASQNQKMSYTSMYFQTLTPGDNIFQAKYAAVAAGTAIFDEREVLIFPL